MTLGALHPKKDDSWEYYMEKYSLLNAQQRSAVAFFLRELPTSIAIDLGDKRIIERALRDYWHQYL
jgi:hypothetical protein